MRGEDSSNLLSNFRLFPAFNDLEVNYSICILLSIGIIGGAKQIGRRVFLAEIRRNF